MNARDRNACLQKADEWTRLAQAAREKAERNPPESRTRLVSQAHAYALHQCAAELRELMGPVRRG